MCWKKGPRLSLQLFALRNGKGKRCCWTRLRLLNGSRWAPSALPRRVKREELGTLAAPLPEKLNFLP